MTAMTLPAIRPTLVGELFTRQPALARFGMALLASAAAMLAMQGIDHRLIDDVNVWAKPTKFAFSIALFACTNAWFFGYVRPERRQSGIMSAIVAVTIIAGGFELAYITWQGAHGLASHFNRSSPFYEIMYGLMGIGALSLTATTLPLAWEIARRPVAGIDRSYLASVITGLVLCFVLGAGVGGYMAQGTGHAVGAVGGQVPIFGWNRSCGDLRIAHFLGIHTQQALPVLGMLLTLVPPHLRTPGLVLGAATYVSVTLLILAQAIAGMPLLAL